MINLDNVKLILLDFDDTLCIHSKHFEEDTKYTQYSLTQALKGETVYNDNYKPNLQLKVFLHYCVGKGILLGLMSKIDSYIKGTIKLKWVKDNYNVELENFCVSSFDMKLNMLKSISEAYNLKNNEILIIDDYWETLEKAEYNGFQAASPMEIINWCNHKDFKK